MLKEKELNNKEAITNTTDYLTIINQLGNGDFLYRGQANAKWLLRSGAARRIWGEEEQAEINYSDVEVYVKELLETVKEKELEKHNQKYDLDCDLKILAQLQHYGAATPLLDFSNNSLIALWMACIDQTKEDGKVFIFNTEQENIKRIKVDDLGKEKKFFDLITGVSNDENEPTYHSCIWEPSHFNARIPAQSSIFFFAKEEYSIEISSIIISSNNKKDILAELENMFGLKEYNIYPDFAGFAQANGAKKAYKVKGENYYIELATKLFQLEQYAKSIEACNRAIDKNKTTAKTFYMRARNKYMLGDYNEAIMDCTEAIKLDPKYGNAYNGRGVAKKALGDNKGAIEDYNKAIKLDPKYVSAYNGRGNAKKALGDNKGAIEDYNKAIKLDPRYALAYNGRGNARKGLGDNEGAVEDYTEAIKLDPKFVYAYNNLGQIYIKMKEFQKAREELLKAKELAEEQNNTGQLNRCERLLEELDKAEQAI